MKQLLTIALFTLLTITSFGQGCLMVSKTTSKETGIISRSGMVSSKDHYSLLFEKRFDPNDSLNYWLFIHAASRGMLTDSMFNLKGSIELFLTNGDKIVIENAECRNNPLGFGSAIAFSVVTNEETLLPIIKAPIEKIKAFGFFETEFSPRNQKRQQKILTCLKDEL